MADTSPPNQTINLMQARKFDIGNRECRFFSEFRRELLLSLVTKLGDGFGEVPTQQVADLNIHHSPYSENLLNARFFFFEIGPLLLCVLLLTAYGVRRTAYGIRRTAYGIRRTAYGGRTKNFYCRFVIYRSRMVPEAHDVPESADDRNSMFDEDPLVSSSEHYVALGRIGNGAYGTVYKARSTHDGAIVALKKIRIHLTEDGFPTSTLREIATLKQIDQFEHPNIIRVWPYLVPRVVPTAGLNVHYTRDGFFSGLGQLKIDVFVFEYRLQPADAVGRYVDATDLDRQSAGTSEPSEQHRTMVDQQVSFPWEISESDNSAGQFHFAVEKTFRNVFRGLEFRKWAYAPDGVTTADDAYAVNAYLDAEGVLFQRRRQFVKPVLAFSVDLRRLATTTTCLKSERIHLPGSLSRSPAENENHWGLVLTIMVAPDSLMEPPTDRSSAKDDTRNREEQPGSKFGLNPSSVIKFGPYSGFRYGGYTSLVYDSKQRQGLHSRTASPIRVDGLDFLNGCSGLHSPRHVANMTITKENLNYKSSMVSEKYSSYSTSTTRYSYSPSSQSPLPPVNGNTTNGTSSKLIAPTNITQQLSPSSFIVQRVERLYGPGALAQGFYTLKKNNTTPTNTTKIAPKLSRRGETNGNAQRERRYRCNGSETGGPRKRGSQRRPLFPEEKTDDPAKGSAKPAGATTKKAIAKKIEPKAKEANRARDEARRKMIEERRRAMKESRDANANDFIVPNSSFSGARPKLKGSFTCTNSRRTIQYCSRKDLERMKEPVYEVDAHGTIINAIDGFGGQVLGCGPPEIVTGSRDGLVKLWDPRQKEDPVAVMEPVDVREKRDCWAVAFGNAYNNQDRVICAGYDNGDVKMFDLKKMAVRWEKNLKNGICSVQFDRREIEMNKLVVTTLESKFFVFELRTQHPKKGFASLKEKAHDSTIWQVSHLPQNRDIFMTCGGNGTVCLWKYVYPSERCRKDVNGDKVGVIGKLDLLQNSILTTQPVHSFDWCPDKTGLALATSFDQTFRTIIVTKLSNNL
ncbi:unnamed protein product [Nesidiocoris tenuis]|uniref:cyclin-dependent kinase n=1 Tax=Nesidiocoris tenuis TaxID=355587 RepID=A0A6H5GZN6_9HEMI|nr:unnamed protein product [Nesidiocoris tenuis]